MYNIRLVNELDGEELWYGNGTFMTLRQDAQDFTSEDMAARVAEGISAGMSFIGSGVSQEEMESSGSTTWGFDELQIIQGDVIIGSVEVYEDDV